MQRKTKTSENEQTPHAALTERNANSDLPVLAAGLVHEVKNPLAAIHLHLQLLENYSAEIQDAELKDKIVKKVSVIKHEINGLNYTLQEFLRYIRPDHAVKKIGYDINFLITEIITFVEPQAKSEEIILSFTPGKIDSKLEIDPSFIKQIVLNLILNSIQAFSQSATTVDRQEIRISTGTKEHATWIRVADNGPGMTAEVQQKIFTPFFTTKKEGSGLGLAIVKKMIAELGGEIEVKSAPGKGTEITIILGDEKTVEAEP